MGRGLFAPGVRQGRHLAERGARGGLAVGALDLLVDLLSVNGDVGGGLDTHLHGVTVGSDDLDDHPAVDDDALSGFP